MTTFTIILLVIAGLFVYFQIGALIGELSWCVWHADYNKGGLLPAILFPFNVFLTENFGEYKEDKDSFLISSYPLNGKGTYKTLLGFLWPFKILFNLFFFTLTLVFYFFWTPLYLSDKVGKLLFAKKSVQEPQKAIKELRQKAEKQGKELQETHAQIEKLQEILVMEQTEKVLPAKTGSL